LLERVEGRVRQLLGVGAVVGLASVALLSGLSEIPAGVAFGGIAVVGGPVVILWGREDVARQALGIYLALVALFVLAQPLAHHWSLAHVGRILGWVGVIVGPAFIWSALRGWSVPSAARHALEGPTSDVGLEVNLRRGYGGSPYASARLWQLDSGPSMPLAQFGWLQVEPIVAADKVPAKAYGVPSRGAVVLVSSSDTVLVGRVRRSHLGESAVAGRPSRLVAWLWKPRSLRGH
jgi:hypothetical protein